MATMPMSYEVEGRKVEPGKGANEAADAAQAAHALPITKNQLWLAVWRAYVQGRADQQATEAASKSAPGASR